MKGEGWSSLAELCDGEGSYPGVEAISESRYYALYLFVLIAVSAYYKYTSLLLLVKAPYVLARCCWTSFYFCLSSLCPLVSSCRMLSFFDVSFASLLIAGV